MARPARRGYPRPRETWAVGGEGAGVRTRAVTNGGGREAGRGDWVCEEEEEEEEGGWVCEEKVRAGCGIPRYSCSSHRDFIFFFPQFL